MRLLATGGAGFIGSALVRYLVQNVGAEVLSIDKLAYAGNLASLQTVEKAPNYRFFKADICDAQAMGEAFDAFRPDRVMHLAAESHVDRSSTGAGAFVQTNVVGTFALLEAARRYWDALSGVAKDNFRFLYASTDEVYGSLGNDGLFREETPYDPSSRYSASKAASDHLAVAWHRTYGLPVIVSNCSNNYGPYHFPEKLIPLVILNALEGKPLPVYGQGSNIRDWLYVEDHDRALHLIAERGRAGEKYNVGGRNERRNFDVIKRVRAIMDKMQPKAAPHESLIRRVADRPGHDARYAIDATRLETELGWKAEENFDTGIEKTVAWSYGSNFVKTMLRLVETREKLSVVADQRGCPTSARDVARAMILATQRMTEDGDARNRGIFHLTGSGEASWADFARAIFKAAEAYGRRPVEVIPITSDQYPSPVKRPENSRLSVKS